MSSGLGRCGHVQRCGVLASTVVGLATPPARSTHPARSTTPRRAEAGTPSRRRPVLGAGGGRVEPDRLGVGPAPCPGSQPNRCGRPREERAGGADAGRGSPLTELPAQRAAGVVAPVSRSRGPRTGPSPVDRGRAGGEHHLVTGGAGVPLAVVLTGGDAVASVRGTRGRPRHRPGTLFADRVCDSDPHREALRQRRIGPFVTRPGTPHGSGSRVARRVVERSNSRPHRFRRLRARWEHRADIHEAFLPLARASSTTDAPGILTEGLITTKCCWSTGKRVHRCLGRAAFGRRERGLREQVETARGDRGWRWSGCGCGCSQ